MPWVQPKRPGPSHTPKAFCTPCAARMRPATPRARASARSVEMTGVMNVMHETPRRTRLYVRGTDASLAVFPYKRSLARAGSSQSPDRASGSSRGVKLSAAELMQYPCRSGAGRREEVAEVSTAMAACDLGARHP